MIYQGVGFQVEGPEWGAVDTISSEFTLRYTSGSKPVNFTVAAPDGAISTPTASLPVMGSMKFTYTAKRFGRKEIVVTTGDGRPPLKIPHFTKAQLATCRSIADCGISPNFGGAPMFKQGWYSPKMVHELPLDPRSGSIMNVSLTGKPNRKMYCVGPGKPWYQRAIQTVPDDQPRVPVIHDYYWSESDCGPDKIGYFPFPDHVAVSGVSEIPISKSTSDTHIIVIDQSCTTLWEAYRCRRDPDDGLIHCDSSAIYDLMNGGGVAPYANSIGGPRKMYNTSVTAGGDPLFAWLLRYDEAVLEGVINHPLRVTMDRWMMAPYFVDFGRHHAGSNKEGFVFCAPIRLNKGWYLANRDSFGPIGPGNPGRAFVECLYYWGAIPNDNTGGGVHWDFDSVAHKDWPKSLVAEIARVPDTAMEIPLMTPGYTCTVDKRDCVVGEKFQIAIRRTVRDDNMRMNPYVTLNGFGVAPIPIPNQLDSDHNEVIFDVTAKAEFAGDLTIGLVPSPRGILPPPLAPFTIYPKGPDFPMPSMIGGLI